MVVEKFIFWYTVFVDSNEVIKEEEMTTFDFRQILDTAGLTYLLLVIAFLLVYIAFFKESKAGKRSQK